MKALTQAQVAALDIIQEPSYTADGTSINGKTGKALWRKGLVKWSDAEQKFIITEKGMQALENF